MRVLPALLVGAVIAGAAVAAVPDGEADYRVGDRVAAASVGIEWGGAEASIRPGAPIDQIIGVSDALYQANCTLNWVWFDRQTGVAYVGTAAHCVDGPGQRVEHGRTGEFGTVVFDSDDAFAGDSQMEPVDFALIEIDEDRVGDTDPEMLSWGGPHGYLTSDDIRPGDVAVLHGSGVLLGAQPATRGNRGGIVVEVSAREFVADLAAVNGDSGSALGHLDTGYALGIISRYGFSNASTDVGPLIPYILEALDLAGFGDVVLAITD